MRSTFGVRRSEAFLQKRLIQGSGVILPLWLVAISSISGEPIAINGHGGRGAEVIDEVMLWVFQFILRNTSTTQTIKDKQKSGGWGGEAATEIYIFQVLFTARASIFTCSLIFLF